MKILVSNLTHHPLNESIYTLSNISDLENSITEVGLLQPLVINQHNQVISGNRRLSAIRNIGWVEVEVEKVEVSDEETASLLIHHNKNRVKTSKEIINEYKTLEDYYRIGMGHRTDLELTSATPTRGAGETTRDIISEKLGVSSSQMHRLLYIEKNDPEFVNLIDEGTLTINQSYLALRKRLNDNQRISDITAADSEHAEGITFYQKSSKNMIEVKDESVQLVFTSPPYWNQRKYNQSSAHEIGQEKTPEEYIENLVSHLDDVKRVLSNEGSFFLNLGDTFLDRNLLNLPHKVVIRLQDNGWFLRNNIVWRKSNPKPNSSKVNLSTTYEMVFHLTKSKKYYYNPTPIPLGGNSSFKSPQLGDVMNHKDLYVSLETRKKEITQGRSIGHNKVNNDGDYSKFYPYLSSGEKNMGDFWDNDIVITAAATNNKKRGNIQHPSPFPHKLVVLPILQTTKENDLVLDPFHGSGTTGDVAIAYNRKYVGYDINAFGRF